MIILLVIIVFLLLTSIISNQKKKQQQRLDNDKNTIIDQSNIKLFRNKFALVDNVRKFFNAVLVNESK